MGCDIDKPTQTWSVHIRLSKDEGMIEYDAATDAHVYYICIYWWNKVINNG